MSEQDTPELKEPPQPDAEPLPAIPAEAVGPALATPAAAETAPTEQAIPAAPLPDAEPLPTSGPAGDEPAPLPTPEPDDEAGAAPQGSAPVTEGAEPEAAEPADHADAEDEAGAVAEPFGHAGDESGAVTPPAEAPESGGTADEGVDGGLAPLSDGDLDSALEALLLVVDSPVEEDALASALGTTSLRVAEHLRLLSTRYTDLDRGIDLRRAGGGWRFYTRDRYAPYVEKLLLDGQRAKLTRAALETLAVIAYRQPVTRARVAAVRGVNCDGVIRTLLSRGLVEETGTDLETGGFLYRTTELFLERLGLSSLDDLPPIAPLLPEVDSIDEL